MIEQLVACSAFAVGTLALVVYFRPHDPLRRQKKAAVKQATVWVRRVQKMRSFEAPPHPVDPSGLEGPAAPQR